GLDCRTRASAMGIRVRPVVTGVLVGVGELVGVLLGVGVLEGVGVGPVVAVPVGVLVGVLVAVGPVVGLGVGVLVVWPRENSYSMPSFSSGSLSLSTPRATM